VNIPAPGDVLAAIFAPGHQAASGELTIGPAGPAGVTLGAPGAEPELEISL
jgi:hypothetical protein